MKSLKANQRRALFHADPDQIIRVYTIQSMAAFEAANALGYWTGNRLMVDDEGGWLTAYQWMIDRMAERIPTFSGDFPVWVDFSRPNTRQLTWPVDPSVLVTADVPRRRMLISDFDAWHCVLNNWPFLDETSSDAFERDYPDMRSEAAIHAMKPTWERIFEFRPDSAGSWMGRQSVLQGCVDRIYSHEIVQLRPVVRRVGKNRHT